MNFVLAICASLFWGTSDFLGGLKTRTVSLVTVLMLSQVAGLAGIAVVLLVRGQPFPADNRILFAVAAAPVNLIALGTIYYATALGPMIVVAPVAALGAALPLIVGLARGNAIGLIGALGIAFALVGVTVTGWTAGDKGRGSSRYIAPTAALVSALATGVFFIFLNEASRPDPYWAVAVTRASSCALIVGYFAIRRPAGASPRRLDPVTIATIAAVGLTDMGAEVSFAAASQTGQLSVISVLASLYPVVTVLLAIIVLRDRATWIQLCGAVVTILGAILLAAASP